MTSNNSDFIYKIVRAALREDIGDGDITTQLTIPKNKRIEAVLITKEDCVVCGLGVASLAFKSLDKEIKFKPLVPEGGFAKKGKILAKIYGRAKTILTAERTVLNFLSHLSGISTKTRKFVGKIKPYKAKIMDTRKTTPGLRLLEKYAVRIGGGYNHRLGLDEMVLVKDNHLKCQVSSVKCQGLIRKIKENVPQKIKVEIEVKNIKEFKEALKLKADVIMLDNMKLKDIKKAVCIRRNNKVKLEVSGNVNLNNVREIAKTGIDMISVGELTHSVEAIDISLEVV